MTPTAETGRMDILPVFFLFSGALRIFKYADYWCPVTKVPTKP